MVEGNLGGLNHAQSAGTEILGLLDLVFSLTDLERPLNSSHRSDYLKS